MAKIIDVPGMGHVEFPDDMSDADIEKAIKRNLAPEKKAAPQQTYNPAEGPQTLTIRAPWADSGIDVKAPAGVSNFFAGAGKAVSDIGRGAQQLGAEALNLFGFGGDTADRLRAQQDEVAQRDVPLMNTGAGVAGNIAGNVAVATLPLGIAGAGARAAGAGRTAGILSKLANPTTFMPATASGGLLGGLQPVGTEDSRVANTLLGAGGGAAGNLIGKGVSAVARPFKKALTPPQTRAVQTLQEAGVPLDAAQIGGAPRLAQAKRFATNNPFSAPQMQEAAQAQQQGFTRAVLRTIGVDATEATDTVMDAARTRIGGMFDQVADRVGSFQLDPDDFIKINTIRDEAGRLLTDDRIGKQISNVLSKIDDTGKLDARTYQQIKGELDNLAKMRDVSPYAVKLRKALDDALMRNASPEDAAMLREARRQWGNLSHIDRAVNEVGDVSPKKLANSYFTKADKSIGVYGRGNKELAKLAKAGKAILPDKLPDSGTAPRLALQSLPFLAGMAAGGQDLYENRDPGSAFTQAAKYGLGVYAAPKMLAAALNRPGTARYLSSGLLPSISRDVLLGAGESPFIRQATAAGLLGLNATQ